MSTFTWSPQTANKTVTPRMRAASFGDGYVQRTADGINYKSREWSLTFVRPKAEIDAIESFIETNAAVAFDWTDPDGLVGRWICESWSRSPQGSIVAASLSATFRQAFGV